MFWTMQWHQYHSGIGISYHVDVGDIAVWGIQMLEAWLAGTKAFKISDMNIELYYILT